MWVFWVGPLLGASLAALMSMYWWHPSFNNDPDAEEEYDEEMKRIHEAAEAIRHHQQEVEGTAEDEDGVGRAAKKTTVIKEMNAEEATAELEKEEDQESDRAKELIAQLEALELARLEGLA